MYLLFLAYVALTNETKLSGQPKGLKVSQEPPFCAKHKYVAQKLLYQWWGKVYKKSKDPF